VSVEVGVQLAAGVFVFVVLETMMNMMVVAFVLRIVWLSRLSLFD
jgi:hypothetical protein